MDSKTKGSPVDINPLSQPIGDEPVGGTTAEQVQTESFAVEPQTAGLDSAVLEEEQVKDEIDIQIDLLADSDWVVRREAVITLGEMGDERCVEPLARALRDGDWQVREVAIEAMGQVGSPAVETLLKLLRDWEVRKYAIAALGKIRDERVLDPLMLQLRNDEFKDDAIDALVALGAPSVEKLIPALRDKDENVRKCAVLALGRIKSAEAIDPLIQMLGDKDWFTRLTAAAALESIGDDRGREAIKPLLKDSDMVVKMRVERILAKWKKQPTSESTNA
ncbi:HEAT repeat domain-containing protein [Nitrospira sp. CMX1]|nr:HEAT repeat domain-containing protein [Nitrospira sp.]MBS0164623.1 HEAT repeat domain-containing protein [Nitrospira sp.]